MWNSTNNAEKKRSKMSIGLQLVLSMSYADSSMEKKHTKADIEKVRKTPHADFLVS